MTCLEDSSRPTILREEARDIRPFLPAATKRLIVASAIAFAAPIALAGTMAQEIPMNSSSIVVEYPSGEFATSLEAIEAAFVRLRSPQYAGRSAILSGQGQEGSGEHYRIVEVGFRDGIFTFRTPVAGLVALAGSIGLDQSRIIVLDGGLKAAIESGTPVELARFLDCVYRNAFGLRPFHGERDYAFGAEWNDSK